MDDVIRPRILLVDDDRRTTRLLAHMLREDGFDVDIASDGAAAIGRLSQGRMPSVLVTDLHVPHVDGVAVAEFARSRAPGLPVVIVTGYPHRVVRLGERMDPVPIVFTKPLDYARLTDELRRVIGLAG
jgi:two-component system response regulator MprA